MISRYVELARGELIEIDWTEQGFPLEATKAALDESTGLLVVVPIFTPIAMDLDFNPLWFAMMVCINLQTSFLTPPFGYALFYFKGVAPPEYTMGDVYRGIIPFVTIQLIGLGVLMYFPEIITWLPGIFFGG